MCVGRYVCVSGVGWCVCVWCRMVCVFGVGVCVCVWCGMVCVCLV